MLKLTAPNWLGTRTGANGRVVIERTYGGVDYGRHNLPQYWLKLDGRNMGVHRTLKEAREAATNLLAAEDQR